MKRCDWVTGVEPLYTKVQRYIRKHNKRTGCCQYGIRAYWSEKNQISLDGKPTRIVEKNG